MLALGVHDSAELRHNASRPSGRPEEREALEALANGLVSGVALAAGPGAALRVGSGAFTLASADQA